MVYNKKFLRNVENKVKNEIEKYNMISGKLAVGVSGGKDSLVTVFILKKLGYKPIGILIDEGICGYREKTIQDAIKYFKTWNLPLFVYSFQEEFRMSLDKIVKKEKSIPCTSCGVLRRYLLNKAARELGVKTLAVGHNLDDEAQSILMNLFQNDISKLARLGPIAGYSNHKNFIRRIKPLRKIKEKEVLAYAFMNDIKIEYSVCPYAPKSFRSEIQKQLNEYELNHTGTKLGILKWFDKNKEKFKNKVNIKKINNCDFCGEPTAEEGVCLTCQMISKMQQKKK